MPPSERETRVSGPWPRSYSLAVVLAVAFVFGALSYLPFVVSVVFYAPGSLVSSSGYLTRSPVGDGLQVVYGLAVLEVAYLLGRTIDFESDCLWLLLFSYVGGVIGYVAGLPGLETTTISGGVFLYETNVFNSAHVLSAFINSATLMGLLVAGIGPSSMSVLRRRGTSTPGGEGQKTGVGRMATVFTVGAAVAFVAYMLPPAFYLVFRDVAGLSAASTGALYTFETDSVVIANPLLFFVLLYLVGSRVNVFEEERIVLALLFIAVLVGAIVGEPMGSYATVYAASGIGAFPNYLANTNSLWTFLASALDVSFAGAFLGFAAMSVSASRRKRS